MLGISGSGDVSGCCYGRSRKNVLYVLLEVHIFQFVACICVNILNTGVAVMCLCIS